jgi:hypothetical protein
MKHYFPDENGRDGSVDDARAGSRKPKGPKPARPKRRRRGRAKKVVNDFETVALVDSI